MKIHRFLLFLLPFSFAFTAGDNCSNTVDAPVTPPMRFSIVDSNGDNLVDSTQSSYLADSIKLFDLQEKEWILRSYMPGSSVGYTRFGPGTSSTAVYGTNCK